MRYRRCGALICVLVVKMNQGAFVSLSILTHAVAPEQLSLINRGISPVDNLLDALADVATCYANAYRYTSATDIDRKNGLPNSLRNGVCAVTRCLR
jgi:hypothetical protein